MKDRQMPTQLVAFSASANMRTRKFVIEPNVKMWEVAFGYSELGSMSIDVMQGETRVKSLKPELGKSKGSEILDPKLKGEFWLHVWCINKWSVSVNVWT